MKKEYANTDLVYGEKQCNALAAASKYAAKFPNTRHPASKTLTVFHQIIRETGSVIPNSNETGRHAEVFEKYEDDILMEVEDNPEISIRRLAAKYPMISKFSVWNIIHQENLYLFHFRKVQAI